MEALSGRAALIGQMTLVDCLNSIQQLIDL